MKITFKSFDNNIEEEKTIEIDPIKHIEFGYDGGRLVLYINSVKVFSNYLAGNDCVVAVNTTES